METESSKKIDQDFVVMTPDKRARIETFDPTIYERLSENYNGFKGHELISSYEFSEDWSSWEIHPNGDEVVILLSGEVTFILQLEEGDKSVSLNETGMYVVVPKGVWHRAKTNVKTRMLFITPGEGTQNKAV